jgi:N-dimethylarginine dimethylaminohydrolase
MKNDRSAAAAPVSDKDKKLSVASEADFAIALRRRRREFRLECLMVGLPTLGTSMITRTPSTRCQNPIALTELSTPLTILDPPAWRQSMPAKPKDPPSPARWGLDSEFAHLREVALCSPEHLSAGMEAHAGAKTIFTEKQKRFDPARAKRQHRVFASTLAAEGVTLRWLPLIKSQAAQTFSRDPLFMTPWGAVLNLMHGDNRRGEYAAAWEFCRKHNIPLWRMVTDGTVEGGDVHVAKPGKILLGHSGYWTTEKGALQVAHWFAEKKWKAKIVYIDPHFLHLDLLFSMVRSDAAIICTDVLSPGVVEQIVEFLEIKHVVRASYRQATKLLCNVVTLGNGKLIMHKDPDNADLIRQLHRLGMKTIELDLSMFVLHGGGPHCLTMPLHREILTSA